ncbi:hypothetical protein SAMN05660900_00221 [Megasphaera cerevisiae DSM 20462]|nr:hypothetical protein SAMN05660900_00221 [Megasphaera cerevisiae DSM 20462]
MNIPCTFYKDWTVYKKTGYLKSDILFILNIFYYFFVSYTAVFKKTDSHHVQNPHNSLVTQ